MCFPLKPPFMMNISHLPRGISPKFGSETFPKHQTRPGGSVKELLFNAMMEVFLFQPKDVFTQPRAKDALGVYFPASVSISIKEN